MDETARTEELLAFFKALADGTRLKIVGLLAQEPRTVEQLSALLNLQPSTVSHHLARLGEAGLVSAQAQSYYNVYRLETGAVEEMARRLLAHETLPAIVADVDADAYDKKVLRDFTGPDGRLKQLPLQRKKFEAVLRHVVKPFEVGVRYSEKRVNEILSQYHEDTAALRRGLVDTGMMMRDHGVYWRVG
jgi:DNA-binding transcriptional ArsR family regulator